MSRVRAGLDQPGFYHPGRSLVHRCPAGTKLADPGGGQRRAAGLAGARRAWVVAVVAVAAAYAVARIPLRLAWTQLRPLRWLVVVLGALPSW